MHDARKSRLLVLMLTDSFGLMKLVRFDSDLLFLAYSIVLCDDAHDDMCTAGRLLPPPILIDRLRVRLIIIATLLHS